MGQPGDLRLFDDSGGALEGVCEPQKLGDKVGRETAFELESSSPELLEELPAFDAKVPVGIAGHGLREGG